MFSLKYIVGFSLAVLATAIAIASYATRPRESTNPLLPRALMGADIDRATFAILARSCFDCHSEATRYPWYSYIAPISILINDDVRRGREHLNLSRWQEYSKIRKLRALSGIANQVRDGLMPLDIYIRFHPEARMSSVDVAMLFEWTQAERSRLIMDAR